MPELRLLIDCVHREYMRRSFLMNGGTRDPSNPVLDIDRLSIHALLHTMLDLRTSAQLLKRMKHLQSRAVLPAAKEEPYEVWQKKQSDADSSSGWYVCQNMEDQDIIVGPFETEMEACLWRP